MEYDKILTEILGRKDFLVVGKNVTRTDALDKALGKARYTADYVPRDTSILKVFRSSEAHARIKSINTSEALRIPGVEAIYTGADITGNNQIGYALPDQPFLNDKKVHYVGDPIALVVARDEYAAAEAMESIYVDYDPLPNYLDIDAALAGDAVDIHEGGNIAVTTKIRKGDAEKGFKEADVEVEDTYWSPYQDHTYIETEAAYAIPDGTGKVTVIANGQSPFLCREKVAHVLGWDLNQVQIIQALTGGAFGGKDDQGPLVSAYAAFAATKLGKPVAHVWSREESLAYSNKRFPARIKYRSGANKKGKVTAIEVDITLECGAYANRSPFWLWRQTAHAGGPYEIDNCSVDGRAVYTTKVYGGSYRGFGDLALHFAAEQQMDKLALELGMDPIEFRLNNVLTEGASTTCDQVLDSSVGIKECLEAVRDASEWSKHREPVWDGTKVRGYGVGLAYHGISTSRSTPDWSAASLLMNQDGSINYRTGIVEIGQGSPFGHIKIVSEITGVPIDKISIELPDTDSTLNAKPTHGSRGLMLGGTAAAKAALKLRENMVACAAELFEIPETRIDLVDGKAIDREDPENTIAIKELAEEMYLRGYDPGAYGYFKAPKRFFDPETGLGVNYSVYTFAATVAEVEVDTETGIARVTRIWPAMDCGKAIDPLIIEGQIEGAISQGMGFTLMENMELNGQGKVLNPNFTDYVIPCSLDTPEIEPCIIVEKPYKHGAFGAKGVGEPAIISIVPTIANAIYHATGKHFSSLPIRPWTLHKALKEDQQ
ncbi:MAG: xanthine dehydrogenase family protein molybdopterin-binding subunit [Candidatus Bathyarchaeota archaeon]|nr:xanthine dehydrogenase family protein molybdopterin-binding subunit [Candidatus Bathyarchaeota archaeon]